MPDLLSLAVLIYIGCLLLLLPLGVLVSDWIVRRFKWAQLHRRWRAKELL